MTAHLLSIHMNIKYPIKWNEKGEADSKKKPSFAAEKPLEVTSAVVSAAKWNHLKTCAHELLDKSEHVWKSMSD